MYYEIPLDPSKAKPIWERFLQENLASSQLIWAGGRRRPQPPRGARVSWTASHFNLNWSPPQNVAGIQGYNIYRWDAVEGGGDTNRILSINDINTTFAEITMPTGFTGQARFWITSFTALMESLRASVIGST